MSPAGLWIEIVCHAKRHLVQWVSAETIKPAMTNPKPADAPPAFEAFDPDSTVAFQRRMERAPEWFCSFLAGNSREKSRLR